MNETEIFFLNQLDKEFKPNHEKTEEGYFTESDYQELHANLALYKEGNREASTYIIRTFHPFLTKYARFIHNGDLPYYTYQDKNGKQYKKVSATISSFVNLFTEKQIDNNDKKKIFSNTCIKIKSLFSKYEYSDIYNELVLALLNMANKYKIITDKKDPRYKRNGTFHMYVSKCFHWEAYRFLKPLIKDPLTHLEVLHLHDQFDDMEFEDTRQGGDVFVKDEKYEIDFEEKFETINRQMTIENSNKLTFKEKEDLMFSDIETLNFNWTSGITCSPIFEVLTPYEREILIASFIHKKSEEEIGEIYGCHRTTINCHKKKAIEKLKAKAIEKGLISQ